MLQMLLFLPNLLIFQKIINFLLHVIPQYYIIDGKERTNNPIGMHGVRLELMAHIITGSIPSIQNLISCCQLAGVAVEEIVLEPIASALSVLTEDEKNLGVGMLDIGVALQILLSIIKVA